MNPKSIIVIFGATGDLAKRKLFPSLYRLYEKGHLNDQFAVVGVARRPLSADEFRNYVRDSVETAFQQKLADERFTSHFYYHPFDVTEAESYQRLKSLLEQLDGTYAAEGNRIFYLAMAPEFFRHRHVPLAVRRIDGNARL